MNINSRNYFSIFSWKVSLGVSRFFAGHAWLSVLLSSGLVSVTKDTTITPVYLIYNLKFYT